MLIHPMPDPIAFSVGPLAVHWYGLMYLAAFAQFIALGRVRIKQPHIAADGWKKEDLDDMLFYGVLGVVLGGRLGEILFYNPAYYFANPADMIAVWKQRNLTTDKPAMADWWRQIDVWRDTYPLGYEEPSDGSLVAFLASAAFLITRKFYFDALAVAVTEVGLALLAPDIVARGPPRPEAQVPYVDG